MTIRFPTASAYVALILLLILSCPTAHAASVSVTAVSKDQWRIENDALARVLTTSDGVLRTTALINKRASTTAEPSACDEFALRFSQGTDTTDTDFVVTTADFRCIKVEPYTPENSKDVRGLSYQLENASHQLHVEIRYELAPDDFYVRKYLLITSKKKVTLERIDVEVMNLADAEQPYRVRAINARGKWSPGLGQPLYGTKSGTFWGIEFPAADNQVSDGTLRCGYQHGRQLNEGQSFRSYSGVVGVSDDPRFLDDAFFAYIDRIRIRPLRLQIQYNSWFDFGKGVSRESFITSVETINKRLCVERGVPPLRAYVIDDGWQDVGQDWTKKTWLVNNKFDPDFASSRSSVTKANSTLGLWMSPGCLFGAQGAVKNYRKNGFEALTNWMSMAGPKYMQLLDDRMVELTQQGVTYFKLDGLFGHLNERNFELHGDRYGLPIMPQLGTEGLKDNDVKLNDAKFNELKIYYLTAGTERLIDIFNHMAKANPDIYIVISNGAYLSAWWLMYVDSVWMINAGDAANGSDRTSELVYRDERYHEIFQREHTKFPMHALFNHEPKKTKTGESADDFRSYLYMNLSRGTGFIELYLKTQVLSDTDWNVLAEGLLWAHRVFPTFKRSRMHGGNPKKSDVYGYTAWNEQSGYMSLHNPSGKEQTYTITLDRAFGLVPESGPFLVSSPIAAHTESLAERYAYGDTITLTLQPREIRILNFDTTPVDWSPLRALQQ